jgi:hypothetical protein
MNSLDDLKIVLREDDYPYFTDAQLEFYLRENNADYGATAYQCLIIKAEDSTITVSGLTTTDTSKYFRRLAKRYRPNNSGILAGGV